MSTIYKIVNLLVFIIILIHYLKKPAREYFSGRAKMIETGLLSARESFDSAKEENAKIEKSMRGIDKETEGLRSEFINDGEEESTKMIESAQRYAKKLLNDTRGSIENETIKAIIELKREFFETAIVIAQQKIEKGTSISAQERIMDGKLKEIETAL